MNTNPTDQAFPGKAGHFTDRDFRDQIVDGGVTYSDGLTKREHLAALAMQGMLANPSIFDLGDIKQLEWVSEVAVAQADALLARLAKG